MRDYIQALELVSEGVLAAAAETITETLEHCNEIAAFGNGGSLSIAEHFVSDLVKGVGGMKDHFGMIRCLGANQVVMTALANDMSYDDVFLEQVKGMGFGSGLVVTFSVSGTSPNILRVLDYYRKAHKRDREETNTFHHSFPSFLSFVGGKCIRDSIGDETIVPCGFPRMEEVSTARYYGVVEGVFSCLAHEIATRVNERTETA